MSATTLHLLPNDYHHGRVGSPRIPMLTPVATPAAEVGLYAGPEATVTGIVCGQCSYWSYDERAHVQVRHASVEHVRACFALAQEQDAQAAAEQAAELRTERYFEGWYRQPDADDLYEDARDRWLDSLRGL